MKTTLRIIGRVLGKLTYVTTAFILATVATVAIFAYAGLSVYEGYYKDYMKVQQAWAEVDNGYVDYLNVVEDHVNTLSIAVSNKTFASNDDKVTAETKLNFLKETVKDVRYSMSYKEKFNTYPLITNAINDIETIVNNEGKEEISVIFTQLDSIEREIISHKQSYNKQAKAFNDRNKKFPESLIADVGSFHVWNEMP